MSPVRPGQFALLAHYLTPRWLRIDPAFAPLRANPRFQRHSRRDAVGRLAPPFASPARPAIAAALLQAGWAGFRGCYSSILGETPPLSGLRAEVRLR